MFELTDPDRQTLAAVCDTIVPAISSVPDPDGFFARKASDLWVPHVIEYALAGMPEEQRASLLALLRALRERNFAQCSPLLREQIVCQVARTDATRAVHALSALTLSLFYGLPDEHGQNPSWSTLGYPGPISQPPAGEKPLVPYAPDGDTTLGADVCIVGSGAGGGVIAGVLSERGRRSWCSRPAAISISLTSISWRSPPTRTCTGAVVPA